MRLTGRDGTSQTLGVIANDDGTGYATAPSYLPSDGSGGVAAPSDANTVITQGMLAASSSVVHRTGDETVAGTKTFTSRVMAPAIELSGNAYLNGKALMYSEYTKDDTSHQVGKLTRYTAGEGATQVVASDEYVQLASGKMSKVDTLVGRGGSVTASLVAVDDGTGYATAPSYLPSDGQGGVLAPTEGGTVITQAMLAASPTVMHRTGDESVAGVKTFSGGIYR